MGALEAFQQIIRVWARRSDPSQAYTPNQIANFALGSGNSANAARVGQTVAAYQQYFRVSGSSHGRRIAPNWEAVRRDHSDLLPGAVQRPPAEAGEIGRDDVFREMIQALGDERAAVRRENAANPISVAGGRRVPELEHPGVVICEFFYEMRREDSFFPIPDGAPVQLVWPGRDARDGTLLSQEPAESRVIVELEGAVDPGTLNASGWLRPKLEELVAAVQSAVVQAQSDLHGLHNRLVAANLDPRRVRTAPQVTESLDSSQRAAVANALARDVTFLWGPPGTGKTHTVGEAIAHWVKLDARVLAVSTANVAVDQICLKARDAVTRHGLERLLDNGRILRLGYARDPEVLRERRFFPDKERARVIREQLAAVRAQLRRASELDTNTRASLNLAAKQLSHELRDLTREAIRGAAVVLTTVMQPCIDPSFENVGSFDVVVVDEASMLPIPYLITAAARAGKQILVAGDFRQLGPISLAQSQLAERWLHRDVFELIGIAGQRVPTHPALAMLKRQRRMHPDISACVNEAFYSGLLEDHAPGENLQAAAFPPIAGTGAVFVEVEPSDECAVEQTGGGSRRNAGTARRTALLAAWFARRQPRLHVAVITPYRAQVLLIQQCLRENRLSATEREHIHVGTVHTFQGSEREVVLWDLVEMRTHAIGHLYRYAAGNRLANVAITRAKGKLVLIGDHRAFSDAPSANTVLQLKAIIARSFGAPARIRWETLERELGLRRGA